MPATPTTPKPGDDDEKARWVAARKVVQSVLDDPMNLPNDAKSAQIMLVLREANWGPLAAALTLPAPEAEAEHAPLCELDAFHPGWWMVDPTCTLQHSRGRGGPTPDRNGDSPVTARLTQIIRACDSCGAIPDQDLAFTEGQADVRPQRQDDSSAPAAPEVVQVSRDALVDWIEGNELYGADEVSQWVDADNLREFIDALFALPVEVEQVKALDPEPYVCMDATEDGTFRLTSQGSMNCDEFKPRPEYSQNEADYQTGGE